MGFHAYTEPADWVTCYFRTRSNFVYDTDRVSGKVRVYLSWSGGPVRDSYHRPDNAGGTSVSNRLGFTEVGFKSYNTGNFLNGISSNKLFAPRARTDVATFTPDSQDCDLSCDITLGSGGTPGLRLRGSDNAGMNAYLDGSSLRVITSRLFAGTTIKSTGSTALTIGHTYNLRFSGIGSAWKVYLDGSLESSFTDTTTFVTTQCGPSVLGTDPDSRFENLYLRPTTSLAATHWECVNYAGTTLASGTLTGTDEYLEITDSALVNEDGIGPYGWYRIYLTGPDHGDGQWGTAYGDASFYRLRDESNMPTNPLFTVTASGDNGDMYANSQMALGSVRFALACTGSYETANAGAYAEGALRNSRWKSYAYSHRPRYNFGAFPNGTQGNETAITAIVAAHSDVIDVWEPRNEPEGTAAASFVTNEMAPFYAAVKAGNPAALVCGPGLVTVDASWLTDFFTAGGGNYIDCFSFHAYNMVNGDMQAGQQSYADLIAVLTTFGQQNKPRFMTEQGFGWQYRGLVWPRTATRWIMLQWFIQELNGIPVENSHYWYDTQHGFDNFPMWWLNGTGPGPEALPIRTMVSEIGNRPFTSSLDFGSVSSKHYMGGKWTADDGSVTVGVIGACDGLPSVRFSTDAVSLVSSDSWGNLTTLTASGGYVTVPVSALPRWVRVPAGNTCALVSADFDFGTNRILGSPTADSELTDGNFENPYYGGNAPYTNSTAVPIIVSGSFLQDINVTRVVVTGIAPWQYLGTLTDFDVQLQNPSTLAWSTVYTYTKPATTSRSFTSGDARCTAESFWKDQWVFVATCDATVAKAVRLYVRGTSYRGYEDSVAAAPHLGEQWNAGQPYPAVYLKEIQVYGTVNGGGGSGGGGVADTPPARQSLLRSYRFTIPTTATRIVP